MEINFVKHLHDVKNFESMDISNTALEGVETDYIIITLTTGKKMIFEIVYDEDMELDFYCYYDMETNMGIQSCDLNDIINFEAI